MLNASRCQKTAARFARLAELSEDVDERHAYLELERLWADMERLAERFDREHDDGAKARIYAMVSRVESVRRKQSSITAQTRR